MSYDLDKERNAEPMSGWDKQVCAHLDYLWNSHNEGKLKASDVDVVFANARTRAEQAIKEQQAQESDLSLIQPRNYAI